jgi:hypothetical protein
MRAERLVNFVRFNYICFLHGGRRAGSPPAAQGYLTKSESTADESVVSVMRYLRLSLPEETVLIE